MTGSNPGAPTVSEALARWEDPLTDAEFREKFLALAGAVLGSRARAAADLVDKIESPGGLSKLVALLRG